jgi:hypothetical protein
VVTASGFLRPLHLQGIDPATVSLGNAKFEISEFHQVASSRQPA